MESKFYDKDKLLVFKIKEEIDDCSVQKIRRRADYEIERYMPRKVVFDFSDVSFMDSAGIGLLMGRYKLVSMLGGQVEVSNITPSVRRIFEMSGIQKVIPCAKKRTDPIFYSPLTNFTISSFNFSNSSVAFSADEPLTPK